MTGVYGERCGRQSLKLPNEIIKHNDDYWTKIIQPMIGDWLTEDTSVAEIAAFAKKAFLRRDFDSFTGDPQFVDSAPVTSCNDVEPACETFSQARASIADLYLWRMNHTANAAEKERMAHEADFAFRQALALCPYNFEAVGEYTAFLNNRNRAADAALIGAMAQQFR